ncbi:hypothetical protein SDC9_168282 [bioreactor metagenome]|uniref:Uncharacterized protein n=1 Tax=bioreactor metagenome TaxID=1076179 RepID=A0A645GAI8_9ZZZZ
MAFQQQNKLMVEGWQHNQCNAYHRQGNHRYLRTGKSHGCHSHPQDASAKDTEHIGGKTDAKGLCRVIAIIQHFSEDAPPKQVENAAGAEHQRIHNQIVRGISPQQHKADERSDNHRHPHIQNSGTLCFHRQVAHNGERYDIRRGPIPAHQPRQMLESGVDDLIHQTGINGDDEDKKAQ